MGLFRCGKCDSPIPSKEWRNSFCKSCRLEINKEILFIDDKVWYDSERISQLENKVETLEQLAKGLCQEKS